MTQFASLMSKGPRDQVIFPQKAADTSALARSTPPKKRERSTHGEAESKEEDSAKVLATEGKGESAGMGHTGGEQEAGTAMANSASNEITG